MTTKRKQPTTVNPGPGRAGGARLQAAGQKLIAAKRSTAAAIGTQVARRRPVVVVLIFVVILVAVRVAGGLQSKSGAAASTAAGQVTSAIANVPASVLDTIGKGTLVTAPTTITGDALTADGKPRILFVGAEYCSYCAAERWAFAVALSRFGTLSGLGEVTSSPTGVYPSTATITFHRATYISSYLSVTAKEIVSNQLSGSSYVPLDTLTSSDESLFESVGGGSFPFIDIGGRYKISGASFDPQTLQGMNQAQIAAALSDPASALAKAIDGAANVITAAICTITNKQPAAVCMSAATTTATAALRNASR